MGRSLADSITKRSDCRLVVAADPLTEARQQAAQAYGAVEFADYGDLLSRRDIQAVVVATPSHLHREITVCAAEAGKHVFCEKPMALSVADCDAMIETAGRAGVKLMVGHVLRLMFPWWRIKELARESELGTPFCVSIRRAHRWTGGGWRAQRELSGGPLFEVSVHELDFMRHLCGEVAQVSAYGGRFVRQDADYYDTYVINLRFRSGALGQLHGGTTTAGHFYDGRIVCPRGTLSFGPEWGTGTVQRPEGEPEPLQPEGRPFDKLRVAPARQKRATPSALEDPPFRTPKVRQGPRGEGSAQGPRGEVEGRSGPVGLLRALGAARRGAGGHRGGWPGGGATR
jgi:predicted dehydrogenase